MENPSRGLSQGNGEMPMSSGGIQHPRVCAITLSWNGKNDIWELTFTTGSSSWTKPRS